MDQKMLERIQSMARQTWEAIGGDYLRMLEEQGEISSMPRSHVMEVVCDASYMLTHGGDKEAYEVWNKIKTYEGKLTAVKPAFPYESYGW